MLQISPDSITLKDLNLITEKLGINYIDASSFIIEGIKDYNSLIIWRQPSNEKIIRFQYSKNNYCQ